MLLRLKGQHYTGLRNTLSESFLFHAFVCRFRPENVPFRRHSPVSSVLAVHRKPSSLRLAHSTSQVLWFSSSRFPPRPGCSPLLSSPLLHLPPVREELHSSANAQRRRSAGHLEWCGEGAPCLCFCSCCLTC